MDRKTTALTLLLTAAISQTALAADPGNRLIDYQGFSKQVVAVGLLRNTRRVSEEDFIRMAKDAKTVVLDARSKAKFDLLHVKGAKHLNFADMTAEDLARVIPDKKTRVLIYCNNNFLNAPDAFATKSVRASLNVHTFNALHSYGYTNVYELKPLLDIHKTKLTFEGTQATK